MTGLPDLPDHDDRRSALLDFERNLVVTAGAGTGKTSLLVGRLLAALVCQQLEPRSVLAVTFTENAAREMRERLVDMLRAVPRWLAGEPLGANIQYVLDQLQLTDEHRGRAQELLEQVDLLRVDTFHGFCLRFLQDNSRFVRLPPDLTIHMDAARDERFERAFVDYLRAHSVTEAHAAFERFEPRELLALGRQLLELPEDSWAQILEPASPADLEARERDLAELRKAHPGARPAWRETAAEFARCYEQLRRGQRFDSDKLDKTPPVGGKRELGAASSEAAKAALKRHRNFLRAFGRANERDVALAVEFLRPLLQQFQEQSARRGEVTFQDMLLLVRTHLRENTALREAAARQLSCILVDEFQDTDPLQYDVLFLLAAQPVAGRVEEPMDLELRPGTLFIVGDAKQSIYRFRRADISAFTRAIQRILDQGGRALRLTANFRSLPPILAFVNRVCERSLLDRPPFQFGYEPVTAHRQGGDEDTVELVTFELDAAARGSANAYQRRQREGHLVVEAIQRLHGQGTPYREMAILLRAAADTRWLMRPLRESAIPYVLEGSRRFYSRQEVILATALINAMACPHDPVPVLAILRSAFSGARDSDILEFLEQEKSLDYRRLGTLVPAGPVQRCLSFLRDLHRKVHGRAVDEALTRILELDHLRLMEGSGFEGAQRLANLERLLQRLLREELLDLQDAAAFLARNTRLSTEDEESDLFGSGVEAVRVLTVHKAKGLEFGTVLLPDMARDYDAEKLREGTRVERLFDADGQEVVAVRVGDAENVHCLLSKDAGREHALAENRRLFYVAATRAQHKLVMIHGGGDGKPGPWLADLEAAEPTGITRASGSGTAAEPSVVVPAVDPRTTAAALDTHRQQMATLSLEVRPTEIAPSRTANVDHHPYPDQESPPDQADPDRSLAPAKELGAAMHDYLTAVDVNRESVDTTLLHRLPYADELLPLAERFHASAMRERLAAARRLWREVPLSFQEGPNEAITNGFVDALLQEPDGRFVAIDWKTDRVPDGDHDAAAERYREQLSAYGRGIARGLGLESEPELVVHFLRADIPVALA